MAPPAALGRRPPRPGSADSAALVAIAHGSASPAAQRSCAQLIAAVSSKRRGLHAALGYVEIARPSIADILDGHSGHGVVVPLLLSRGYHMSVDLERASAQSGMPLARPLGPHALVLDALVDRLTQAGAPRGVPIVLGAAGTSDPRGRQDVEAVAAQLSQRMGVAVTVGYVAGTPSVAQAVASARARGAGRVAVASYILSPGRFAASVHTAGADWSAGPLGAHDALAALVLERYDEAAGAASARPHISQSARRGIPGHPAAPVWSARHQTPRAG